MADGFVTLYVNSATEILGMVNDNGFSSLVSGVNAIAIVAATIAFILAILNQILQIGYMSPSQMLSLMIKIVLISYIGLKWGNFSVISNAIKHGMDKIVIAILETIVDSTKYNTSLPGSIDVILSRISTASDKALTNASWYSGAGLSVVIVLCLTLLGAVSALVIIYSKIMISLYIMIAPLFICCLIFERLSDYFYRWLQGAICYLLYPVISAAIMALIAGITNSFLNSIDDGNITTIAMFIPFITLTVIATIIIMFIPGIVAGLSGVIQHISPILVATTIKENFTISKKEIFGNINQISIIKNRNYMDETPQRKNKIQ